MDEFSLESVREAIQNIYTNFPKETRSPEIEELLQELIKVEQKLISRDMGDTT